MLLGLRGLLLLVSTSPFSPFLSWDGPEAQEDGRGETTSTRGERMGGSGLPWEVPGSQLPCRSLARVQKQRGWRDPRGETQPPSLVVRLCSLWPAF